MASLLLAVLGGDYRVQIVLQDAQTFIDDRQGQIIIGVVVEGATGVNVIWFFIAKHSEVETARVVERERV